MLYMIRCICDIVCTCNADTPPSMVSTDTSVNGTMGACLLGKTRPIVSHSATTDQLNLFNISNEYRTYAYTLSPKGVGIMANKSRDRQYETLKRLHTEVLSNFECSYIINIEIYPGDDNSLHCHGMMRFRNHSQKEKFKKLLKEKITLNRKGTYSNLIDCEFISSFDQWSAYIMKAQEALISNTNYYPFIKIDYSFHSGNDMPFTISIPVASKTIVKSKPKPKLKVDLTDFDKKHLLQLDLIKAQAKVNKLLSQISNLKNI